MALPPPPSGFRPDPLETVNAWGVKITNGFRTPADTERIRRQGYKPAKNSLHLDADAIDLTPGDSGLTMGQLYGKVSREIAAAWPGARVFNEGHHVHVQLPGWGGAPGLPEPSAGFAREGSAPEPSSEAPQMTVGGARRTGGEFVQDDFSRQIAGMVQAQKPIPDILAFAEQQGRPFSPELQAQLIEAHRRAGAPGARVQGGYQASASQASLSAHNPTLAERLGDTAGDAVGSVFGDARYGARFGNKVEGLLDWTTVGDVDAYRAYGEAQDRAVTEGRYLDAFGNMVGQDLSAMGILPVVGHIRKGGKAITQGAESLAERIFRREAGAAPDGARGVAAAGGEAAPSAGRVVDRIDVGNLPPPPKGFVPEADPALGKVRPLDQQASPEEIAAAARNVRPEDVTPVRNVIDGPEELERIGDGRPLLPAPDERKALEMRRVRNAAGKEVGYRGPLDAEAFLRSRGGLREEAGELRHIGITNNKPRPDNSQEGRLGRILDNQRGLTLDEAGEALWEAGYFRERPTTADVVDMLRESRLGRPLYLDNDLDEVARFDEAQAQRFDVEAAEQRGAPLADDIGEPAGFDDLAKREPDATAYEDLPRVGGTVANINLDKMETRGDIRRALQNVEVRFGGFDAARRGKVTQAETSALASELNMTADDLLKRRRGQALNAEQALQARRILARSADELVTLASKASGGSEADLVAFQKALLRHAAIQEQVTGATAEAGRALSSFKILARSRDHNERILKAVIEGQGGRGRIEDVAEAILDLQKDPSKLNAFALAASKPKLRDKLTEYWINSLLSGPQTHAVNFVSNTITQLGQIPEHIVAAGIGSVRRAVGKGQDSVLFSEAGARAVGMVSGVKRGLLNGVRAFRTETPSDMMNKAEQLQQRAISGTKGKIIRIPTRALMGADEIFKGMARQSAMDGMAMRIAYREGKRGAELRKRAAELAATPTPEMVEEAFDYARYVTFQRPSGWIGSGIMHWKQKAPVLTLVIPFVRTPGNLIKYSLERSPVAPLLSDWRKDFMAGGAKRDLAISRAVVGSGIGALVASWAAEGKISGGTPPDRSAGKLKRADGWQPYSIKIGDEWVSYQRLDPYATIFGLASELATKGDHMTPAQQEKHAAFMVGSILRQLESKSWISGFVDLIKGVEGLARGQTSAAQNWVDRTVGSIAVPTGVSQAARLVDPVQREAADIEGVPDWADSSVSRVISRIPGASDSLPAKRDVWGREITSEGGAGPDVLSPLWVSREKNDPVNKEMLRLGARFGDLDKVVGGVRSTPEQHNAYQEMAGRYTYEAIAEAMVNPEWENLSDAERLDWVDEIKRDARAAARDELGLGIPPPPPGFSLVQ